MAVRRFTVAEMSLARATTCSCGWKAHLMASASAGKSAISFASGDSGAWRRALAEARGKAIRAKRAEQNPTN